MNWRRARKGLLGIVAAGVIGTSGVAFADEEALDDSMNMALDALQPLLIGLVNSDYEAVLRDIEPILKHAAQLSQTIPDGAKENREEYLAYTYNMQENAKILKSTVAVLVRGDQAKEDPAGLNKKYLPVVAATHYGGIVNMCVACHNRFRVALEP